MLQFLDNLWRLFIFSNYKRKIGHFTLDLVKRSDTSEKFLIVDHSKEDHSEREFKCQAIGGILELPKKSSKTIVSGSQLNAIASTMDLLKKFSEVTVASKCGPKARIEKQAMS